jgi:cyclopropane-fatty-acyl-phospholipid synthase
MRPMKRVVLAALKKFVRAGNLRITPAQGRTYTLGDGTGKPVALRFTTRAAERAVILDPELKFGESYMDGTLRVEEGSIADALAILLGQGNRPPSWARPRHFLRYTRRLSQLNWRSRARRNVAHHYDLDGRLYSLFLDGDRQYSCAYRSTMRSSPSGVTLPPSSWWAAASACSTSAAAGAALRSTSRRPAAAA